MSCEESRFGVLAIYIAVDEQETKTPTSRRAFTGGRAKRAHQHRNFMENANAHLRTMVNEDGAAILDTRLGAIFTLNTTAARVWQGLGRGETLETIAANLASETGEEIETLKSDISSFIEDLKHRQLLPR
jgi:hypothetical protein